MNVMPPAVETIVPDSNSPNGLRQDSVNAQAIALSLLQPDRNLLLESGELQFRQIADGSEASRIRREFGLSAMALYHFIINQDGYHNIEHTGDTLHFSDRAIYKEDLRVAFGIEEELSRYNDSVPEEDQISVYELPGLFGIVWLSHDMGNNGRLDPRLTDLMIDFVKDSDSVSLASYAALADEVLQKKVESIRSNYNNSGLVPNQHTEVGAVENSLQIAEYLLTYTISTAVASSAMRAEEGALLMNRYRKFIDFMISYTDMNVQDEGQRIRMGTLRPFEAFVKTVDRIASYAGKNDKEVWAKISALAKEKVSDGEHISVTRVQLYNFASTTLKQFYPRESDQIVSILDSQCIAIPSMEGPTDEGRLTRYDWSQIAEF